jgi:hypothetical protein
MLWMVKTVPTFKGGIFSVDGAKQNWHQSGLPVVAVKNVRHAQDFRRLQNGSGKQGEALGIVGIVPGRGAIESVAVEVWRVLDKIEFHTALTASAHD